jgi:antitoxin component YwqK of YwqJK toxin-antitoxin module
MKVKFDDLFTDTDIHTGEDMFFVDSDLKIPYNGVVVDYFKGALSWEFDVQDGYRTGIEKKYYNTGELMEQNNTDHNTINGIAKEFYRNGQVKSVGIAIRNVYIDAIFYDEAGNVVEKTTVNENNKYYSLVAGEIDEYRSKYKI